MYRAKVQVYAVSNQWAISVNMLVMTDKFGACLVYCVNKHLCVVHMEATDHFILIFTREDRLDQGREFLDSERASDQASTC